MHVQRAFSGFAVKDIDAAKAFYTDVLDLAVEDQMMGLARLLLSDGYDVLMYPKADQVPATYTMLNFEVGDIESSVDELSAKGVTFARYDGMEQDDRGIARYGGVASAWFTDPSGNIIALFELAAP